MRQLSLVGFHGDKPEALAGLLREARSEVAARLGDRFRPYRAGQVHGTLIGLERAEGPEPLNRNLVEFHGERSPMDLAGFLDHVRAVASAGISLRIGGFSRLDRPLLSRGATPFERGFSIQGDKVVLMGWPVARSVRAPGTEDYPDSLESLRRGARRFGIVHAYHRLPGDRDNDFYLRLGLLSGLPSASQREAVEEELRRWLAERSPTYCELSSDSISVVAYTDATLPEQSTRRRALSALEEGSGALTWASDGD